MWPHEDVSSLNEFYGDPRGPNGQANPHWEAANLVPWTPPYPLFYSDGNHTPMRHLRVHAKALGTFNAAFSDVLNHFGLAAIQKLRLDTTGGTYCYRVERGGSRLSVHSWGCAIDMDPGHNPFPHPWQPGRGMIDPDFARILQLRGFTWRGRVGDDDPMHFQLATR